MSVLNKVLGLFLGNKYERDLKEMSPFADKVKSEYEKLSSLSNDDLRSLTKNLKERVMDSIKEEEEQIATLKDKAAAEDDVIAKEGFYDEIDKIEEKIDIKLENFLDELLPEAYAVVRKRQSVLKRMNRLR